MRLRGDSGLATIVTDYPSISTSGSTSRWCRRTGGRSEVVPPEPAGREPGWWRGPPVQTTTLPVGPRTVVVAGDDAGPPARGLAETAGWPLLAEPSSGSRTGEHAIRCYRLLLGGPLGRGDRAGGGLRSPDAVASRVPAPRPRGRRGVGGRRPRASACAGPTRSSAPSTGSRPRRPTPRTGSSAGARPTRGSAATSTRCSPPSPTSRRTTSRARSRGPCRPRACSSSARRARSATST